MLPYLGILLSVFILFFIGFTIMHLDFKVEAWWVYITILLTAIFFLTRKLN